ncbi:MAG: class I SAM-dependent methyltransferase [Planctomycetes bacterium]|nr:class I SAM-dependent methyltransferase [Planctomycetota bacterium]
MSITRSPRRCPACDMLPRRTLRLSAAARLWQCPRCLLAWWDWPAAWVLDPSSFYDRDYFQSSATAKGYDDYHALEAGVRRTGRSRLRLIDTLLRTGGGLSPRRLLDVGCGTGCFLDEARRAGWQVSGIEVSGYAAEQARQRGLAVACAAAEGLRASPQTFDCVTLWDVLEHLRDPQRVLAAAARALRPNGVLALSTGDVTALCARLSGARWHLYNIPEHLFFFSPRALHKMLGRAGFVVGRVVRELNWVPVVYLLERLRKSAGGRSPTVAGSASATPARGWRRLVVPATLLDVIGVYATRVT